MGYLKRTGPTNCMLGILSSQSQLRTVSFKNGQDLLATVDLFLSSKSEDRILGLNQSEKTDMTLFLLTPTMSSEEDSSY